ncbi:MAG TPA: histidine phosphatase family protein [Vicinamibacterales bacterium]
MKTRIFLVRHGATTLSNEDRCAGSTDVLLGDDGRRQVERLSARLTAAPIAAVYCSPMRRTVDDRLEQLPACLNLLEFTDTGNVRLVLLNDVSHYEYDPVLSPDRPVRPTASIVSAV